MICCGYLGRGRKVFLGLNIKDFSVALPNTLGNFYYDSIVYQFSHTLRIFKARLVKKIN